ncbi:MAG: SAM-dependent methyltransferase [Bacteroidetes bacterium]|nr:SAM-dependent methyltransferase [Bacteroidota bacterium]
MTTTKYIKRLFLIPTTLGDSEYYQVFPPINKEIVLKLSTFIVEDLRSARRFLKKNNYPGNFDDTTFYLLNEHTREEETISYLISENNNEEIGLMSEAGMPCLADPGSLIVKQAHHLGVRVIPLTGPSSIILALIASGFTGQNFLFHGYLPIKLNERIKVIKEIENDAWKKDQTQIFIEAPYRNQKLLNSILDVCNKNTMLCIATDITLRSEFIVSKPIREWRKAPPEINKKPTVFLLSK